MSTIQELIPVPGLPQDTASEVMSQNEKSLGVSFPDDFKEFGRSYGTGRLIVGNLDTGAYTIKIYSPGYPDYPAVVKSFFGTHDEYRKAMETEDVDLGLFPEPGGLLPFAYTDDGVHFAWRTKGAPSAWTVCYISTYESGGYQLFDVPFAEFVRGFIEGHIKVGGFDFTWDPKTEVAFKPGLTKP